MVLMFLLLPAVAIPLLVGLKQYAVDDQRAWLVSVDGGPPSAEPPDALSCEQFRGVSTIELGYSDRRKDRFIVSSFSPFANPHIEREWVRYLFLPRDSCSRLSVALGSPYEKHATLEHAQHHAHAYLK